MTEQSKVKVIDLVYPIKSELNFLSEAARNISEQIAPPEVERILRKSCVTPPEANEDYSAFEERALEAMRDLSESDLRQISKDLHRVKALARICNVVSYQVNQKPAVKLAFLSIVNDELSLLEEALEGIDDVNEFIGGESDKVRLLGLAVKLGRTEFVKKLIQAGADPDKESSGETPLREAILEEETHIAYYLLDNPIRKADPHLSRPDGQGLWPGPPLFAAVGTGNLGLVQRLVEADADLTMEPARRGLWGSHTLSIAYAAVCSGNADVLHQVLELGAPSEPRSQMYPGVPPIFRAASDGRDDLIDLLHRYDAKIDFQATSRDGSTALAQAASTAQSATVQKLLLLGARKSLESGEALAQAATSGSRIRKSDPRTFEEIDRDAAKIVVQLIERGSPTSYTLKYRTHPLLEASSAVKPAILQALIDTPGRARLDLHVQDPAGNTSLDTLYQKYRTYVLEGTPLPPRLQTAYNVLVRAHREEEVRLLAKYGNDDAMCELDMHGEPAIIAAARNGYDTLFAKLLSNAARPEASADVKNSNGATALMLAARRGDLQMTNILLGHGANPKEADGNELRYPIGVTLGSQNALRNAAAYGHPEVFEALVKQLSESGQALDEAERGNLQELFAKLKNPEISDELQAVLQKWFPDKSQG